MSRLEELKKEILRQASKNPDRFFAVDELKRNGFSRSKCEKCGKYFWSVDEDRNVCGDVACIGSYGFIDNSPTDRSYSYSEILEKFQEFMSERGYKPIGRYPVVARWRDDTEFVRASIYDFQPYVVSGEVEPPGRELVIPQPSLRFNDIDNVGITGSHYVLHDHIGQHAFRKKEEYNQSRYFKDMLDWALEGMELKKERLVLHEDSWGGGGNLGACMEFFVDGLELWNQVYMFYKITDGGYKELDLKVLDMGMGHERITWITHGTETSYQAVMPEVMRKLRKGANLDPDKKIWKKFLPYSGLLNVDEIEDVERVWREVADKIDVDKEILKKEIKPMAALYSIADHARALLFAFVDGALPSNTGEKHSLRVIARRALDFIEKYGWDIDLSEVMKWHAEELENIFPELKENIREAREIMDHEKKKYGEMQERAKKKIGSIKSKKLSEDKIIELYDSDGISPDMLKRMGFDVDVPDNFYVKVAERHGEEGGEKTEAAETVDVEGLEETELLCRTDEKKRKFKGKVVKVVRHGGKNFVVLDRTYFYPESGGQMYDKGRIGDEEVLSVMKAGGVVLHEVEEGDFTPGQEVECEIEWARRKQLMQHHSATHLINGAAQEVLGNHVWQAGAKKTMEKGRLDITHYEKLSSEEAEKIEELANKWVEKDLSVTKTVMGRREAEEKYGFRLYQGGVPPENKLRIVVVGDNRDVEACGGTHVDNTGEIGEIIVTNTKKIQDGVIRIEFKAGEAAKKYKERREKKKDKLIKIAVSEHIGLKDNIDKNIMDLEQIADTYSTDVKNLEEVIERFVEEWKHREERIRKLGEELGEEFKETEKLDGLEELFNDWKRKGKLIGKLEEGLGKRAEEEALESESKLFKKSLDVENIGVLIKTVKKVVSEKPDMAVVLVGRNAVIASKGEESDVDIRSEVEKEANVVKESDGIVKGFDLKD